MIYTFFDTETTGLNLDTAGIISLSYILVDENGTEIQRGTIEMNPFEKNINGDWKYDSPEAAQKAMEVNGYQLEQVLQFQSVADGLKEFNKVLQLAAQMNGGRWTKLVGYNSAAYDMTVLNHAYNVEMEQTFDTYSNSNKPSYQQWCWFKSDDVMILIDTLCDMGVIEPFRGHRLSESAEHFGIKLDESKLHTSIYDTEVTVELWKALQNILTTK